MPLQTHVEDWGLIDYQEALEKQLEWVKHVQENPNEQAILVCSHPPIVTLGRKTKPEDIFAWSGETLEVQRGGRATYHGPNQIVIYPIVNLSVERKGLKTKDLHGYIRLLEKCVIDVLAERGVECSPRPSEEFLQQYNDVEASGIWYGNRKLGSIGIGVKKWVTYHGLAINLSKDTSAFQGMNPCGFSSETPICLEEIATDKTLGGKFTSELAEIIELRLLG